MEEEGSLLLLLSLSYLVFVPASGVVAFADWTAAFIRVHTYGAWYKSVEHISMGRGFATYVKREEVMRACHYVCISLPWGAHAESS